MQVGCDIYPVSLVGVYVFLREESMGEDVVDGGG